MTDTSPIDFIISEASEGERIDAFLAAHVDSSRTLLRKAIDSGAVLLNGATVKASRRLVAGDHITGDMPVAVADGPTPEDIPLDVLFEDDHLVAINKPPGMVVHPAKGHWSGTLTAALAFHFESLSSIGGANRPGIVHRLDRDTSGVILVAKTDQAHQQLAGQFERREIKKEYRAVCRGVLDRDQDQIDQPIGTHPYQREKMAIRSGDKTGKQAVTVFRVERRFRGFLQVTLLPKTGRTHQLRVHMAHIGCPIVADRLYAGHGRLTLGEITKSDDDTIVIDRQALHAFRIAFTHPESGDTLSIEAPMPDDIAALLQALERYRGG